MSCERCGGFMLVETVCHLMEEESRRGNDTARCVNCGNFEDAVVRANRAISRLPGHLENPAVEARSPRAVKPIRLEQVIQTEGSIAECPRDRAPRPPGGAPSAKRRMPESPYAEPDHLVAQTQRRCA
jgi:hypothetical protein